MRGLFIKIFLLCVGLTGFVSATIVATETTNKAAAPIKLRLAYPSGMNGQIPVTMEKTGIAKKHGLEIEYVFFQYGPPMMEALASGHVDAVITSLMPVTTFLSRQPDAATIVASLGSSSYSLMVAKDSPITNIQTLRGKSVAVSFNSDSHLDLIRTLKSVGLDAKTDVKLLNVQPGELMLTLSKGFADAIVIRQPQVLKLEEQLNAKTIHTWQFNFVSIMRTEFLKNNPVALERYRAALRESVYYIATNKEQTSIWFGEKLRVAPEVVRRASVDDPTFRGIKKLGDVSITFTAAQRKMVMEWFNASAEHGMIGTKMRTSKNLFAK